MMMPMLFGVVLYVIAQQTPVPIPTPPTNSVEAWAPTGVMGAIAAALFAFVRQMLTTFKEDQAAERKAASERWDSILRTFKEDQAAERKRSDDMLDKERLRADANATRMWATMEQFRESFTCKFSGPCQYQASHMRLPPMPPPNISGQ